MRILQLNLNHCKAAQCLLDQTEMEVKPDLVYEVKSNPAWKHDINGNCAMWLQNGRPTADFMTINKGGFVRGVVSGIAATYHIALTYTTSRVL